MVRYRNSRLNDGDGHGSKCTNKRDTAEESNAATTEQSNTLRNFGKAVAKAIYEKLGLVVL